MESTTARIGLSVATPDRTRAFWSNVDGEFAQASAIKILILWELHRAAAAGELSLEETIAVDPQNGAGGCGVLQQFRSGVSRVALADLAILMIVLSDNVATNLLIDRLGMHEVNQLAEGLGLEHTRLRRRMMDFVARSEGRENTGSPGDAVGTMTILADREEENDPVATAVLQTLRLTKESPVTAALPKSVRLATKPGMLEGLRTEWSFVETADGVRYAMALMADGASDSDLEPLFRALADAIHTHMTV